MAVGTWSQTAPAGVTWSGEGEHALYPNANWYHKIVWASAREEGSKNIVIKVDFYGAHQEDWTNASGTTTAYISVNGDVSTKGVTTKGYTASNEAWRLCGTWYYTVEASSRDTVMIGNGSAAYALEIPGGDLIPVFVKANGAWAEAQTIYVKTNGSWKEGELSVKQSGAWAGL